MIGPLIDGAIKRRKVVLAVTLIASLFGFFAYLSMPRESNPNIDFPFITVVVPYPGVSPEDAERLLVRPLETELQTIEGVKEMNAVARQSMAIVNLEFEADFNKDKALGEVRAKVDGRGKFRLTPRSRSSRRPTPPASRSSASCCPARPPNARCSTSRARCRTGWRARRACSRSI